MTELKDKAPPLVLATTPAAGHAPAEVNGTQNGSVAPAPAAEAVSALLNLGYAPLQANAAISTAIAKAGEAARTEDSIWLGLKELAR